MKDKGRYHLNQKGGGQITLTQAMAKQLGWKNKSKLLCEVKRKSLVIKVM